MAATILRRITASLIVRKRPVGANNAQSLAMVRLNLLNGPTPFFLLFSKTPSQVSVPARTSPVLAYFAGDIATKNSEYLSGETGTLLRNETLELVVA
jgi:hypothetical protein